MDGSLGYAPVQAEVSQSNAANRVVVLGALSAIATATARIYAREGAALVLVARNQERLDALAADLYARGAANVAVAVMDLEAEARNAGEHLEAWVAHMGGVDHIQIVYGYLGSQPEATASPAELSRIVTSNFTSAVHWCEAAANILRRQKHGALVAVSSVAGDRGRQSNYAYGAAKGGLALYVQGIAHSLAGTGARAVAVKPGFVDTPMTDGLKKGGAMWASADQIGRALRRAADRGGPIQYAPGKWRVVMAIIRAVPAFLFHKTKF
jgi:short-subunit dehydrogenase